MAAEHGRKIQHSTGGPFDTLKLNGHGNGTIVCAINQAGNAAEEIDISAREHAAVHLRTVPDL